MNPAALGVAIIIGIGIAITAVNVALSRMTIRDQREMYEGMLETRKNEIIDLTRANQKLCEHNAKLEAELSGIKHRINPAQEEFFKVPSKKVEFRQNA